MAKKRPAKTGRPKREVDWGQVARLAQHFMTCEQVCAIIGISRNTLNVHCQDEHGMPIGEFLTANRTKSEAMLMGVTMQKARDGDSKCLLWMNEKYVAPRNAPEPVAQKVEIEHSVQSDAAQVFRNASWEQLVGVLDEDDEAT